MSCRISCSALVASVVPAVIAAIFATVIAAVVADAAVAAGGALFPDRTPLVRGEHPVAAITVMAPINRMPEEEFTRFAQRCREAADRIERKLKE